MAGAEHSEPAEPSPRRPRRARALPLAIVVGLVMTAVGPGLAVMREGVDAPEGPMSLSVWFEEGTTYRYRMTMAMDVTMEVLGRSQPMRTEVASTLAMRVTDVDEDGVMTMEMKMEDLEGTANGQPFSEPGPALDTTLRIAPNGRILEQGEGFTAAAGAPAPGAEQFTPVLPERPVEPGDTWERTVEQAFPVGEGAVTTDTGSRFLRYEDRDGAVAAVVASRGTSRVEGTSQPQQLEDVLGLEGVGGLPKMRLRGTSEFDSTTWLDVETGELLRTQSAGPTDITTSFLGEVPGVPGGTLETRMDGEIRMTMERL